MKKDTGGSRSKRKSPQSRAARAADVLDNPEFIQAEQKAVQDVHDAMIRLRITELPYDEAAGLALSLVAKLQAVTEQSKGLRRLINSAVRLDTRRAE